MNRLRTFASFAAPLAAAATLLAACTDGTQQLPPATPCPTVTPQATVAPGDTGSPQAGAPTEAEAKAFMDGVDKDLRKLWTQSQRAGWVN